MPETKNKLVQAVLKVMEEVKNIDKNMTVGTGRSSYAGVADKDVKQAIGSAMQKNGLTIFPVDIEPNITRSEWDESSDYGTKHKALVFTEVKTKYLLMHESGESMEIVGYGHGSDSQDKSAGKATTYALKNALLYTFLVPTGAIDDTDNTHSDNLPQKPKTSQNTTNKKPASDLTMPCEIHNETMHEWNKKDGTGTYFAHKHEGKICFGK